MGQRWLSSSSQLVPNASRAQRHLPSQCDPCFLPADYPLTLCPSPALPEELTPPHASSTSSLHPRPSVPLPVPLSLCLSPAEWLCLPLCSEESHNAPTLLHAHLGRPCLPASQISLLSSPRRPPEPELFMYIPDAPLSRMPHWLMGATRAGLYSGLPNPPSCLCPSRPEGRLRSMEQLHRRHRTVAHPRGPALSVQSIGRLS